MPKSCHTYLHGSGIKEITPRPRCIKIIKLNINILRGRKQNRPSMLGRISPLVAESPLLQATKNEPPFMYEQPRDCLNTTPLKCFIHKVERRVVCVLAQKFKASLLRN